MRVAVAGATGFIGAATRRELTRQGHEVVALRVPRLTTADSSLSDLVAYAESHLAEDSSLRRSLASCHTLINAAGNPDASSVDRPGLLGANAAIPALLGVAARQAGVRRVVHVSSAVVQGDRPVLDDTPAGQGFSAYSMAKVTGEQVIERLHELASEPEFVLFRPPSVHSPDRRVSRMTAKIARSRISSVAGSGDHPSPQALIDNVAAAVAFLGTHSQRPPLRVHYPAEGLTTGDLMRILGGKEPVHLPVLLAKAVVRALKLAGRVAPRVAADARRVEILWLGQSQAASWLTEVGWNPPVGREGWIAMAHTLRSGEAASSRPVAY
jgi:nucleoside-diphosphate-sugar epimerase